MQLSLLLKWGSIGWVGMVLLVGLLINGDRLYSWIGSKFKDERDWMQKTLDLMFIEVSTMRMTLLFAGYFLSLFALGVFLLYPSMGAGAAFGLFFLVVGWKLPRRILMVLFKRRINKFVVQMVDGLTLISNALRSGLNISQAMSIVTDELPNPISQEFGLVLDQNKLGITLEEALGNLSVRLPHDDVEMFTTSVNILKETGGNLSETFDKIAYTIRERIKIEAKISAMVAQGVLQGVIVVLLPFVLGAILYTIDPERVAPMFTTVPGWILLTIMITMQAAGGWMIWKIIRVKV